MRTSEFSQVTTQPSGLVA